VQYTDEEICKEYRTAKDKRSVVQVLAELNACGKDEIVRILKAHGEEVDARWGAKKKPKEGKSMILVDGNGKREVVQDTVYGKRNPADTANYHPVNAPEPTREPVLAETVLSVVHETGARLGDCLSELGRINEVLFGPVKEEMPPLPPADCMADEVFAIREVTLRIWSRINALASRMGC